MSARRRRGEEKLVKMLGAQTWPAAGAADVGAPHVGANTLEHAKMDILHIKKHFAHDEASRTAALARVRQRYAPLLLDAEQAAAAATHALTAHRAELLRRERDLTAVEGTVDELTQLMAFLDGTAQDNAK
jgi:hypothetical protein